MVWARTRLLIWDYVFEPVRDIKMSYTGPHPDKLYKKIAENIRTIINVPEGYVQEKAYDWQKAEGGERFNIEWEITKLYDNFTYMVLELSLKGVVSKGAGKASIMMKPRMVTEYPQDTLWQQSIIYEMIRRLWHVMFYHRKRMEYLDKSKDLMIAFEGSMKHYFEELREGRG